MIAYPQIHTYNDIAILIAEDENRWLTKITDLYNTCPTARVVNNSSRSWVKDVVSRDGQLSLDPNTYYVFHLDVQGNEHVLEALLEPLRSSSLTNFLCVIFTGNKIPDQISLEDYDEADEFMLCEFAKGAHFQRMMDEILGHIAQVPVAAGVPVHPPIIAIDSFTVATRTALYTYIVDSFYSQYSGRSFTIDTSGQSFNCELTPGPQRSLRLAAYDLVVAMNNNGTDRRVDISAQGQTHSYELSLQVLQADNYVYPSAFIRELVTAFILTELANKPLDNVLSQLDLFKSVSWLDLFKEYFLGILFEVQATQSGDVTKTRELIDEVAATLQCQTQVDNILYGLVSLDDEQTELVQRNTTAQVSVQLRGVNQLSKSFQNTIQYTFLRNFLPDIEGDTCFKLVGLWQQTHGFTSFTHHILPVPDAAYQARKNRS